MSKPYFYVDRYSRSGYHPAIQRNIPTEIGSHVRVAFHGIGTGERSLEIYVQPNGHWFVETGPGPVHSGKRTGIVRGRLPVDGEPESVCYEATQYVVIGVNEDGSYWTLLCETEEDAQRLLAADPDAREIAPLKTMRRHETDDGALWLDFDEEA